MIIKIFDAEEESFRYNRKSENKWIILRGRWMEKR
jgi:hypothetical protein